MKIQIVQHQPRASGITKRHMAKFKSTGDWPWRGQCVWFGTNGRLHRKESKQIRKEQCLVCDPGKRRENLLHGGAGLNDGAGQKSQSADGERSGNCPPNHVDISGVITSCSDHGEEGSCDESATSQVDVLFVNLVGKFGEAID